jgi:hypothetical protein
MEEMVPLKGLICALGTNTFCAPCWSCHSCGCVTYLQDEREFELWIAEYTDDCTANAEESLVLMDSVDTFSSF